MVGDEHYLQINDEGMDAEGRLLVNRLVMAAASPEVRREMQVEDEILLEIESRDTALMLKDQEIEQKDQEIEQKDQEIEQKTQEIEQKTQEIEQKDGMLRAMVRHLSASGMSIQEIATVLGAHEDVIRELQEKP